MSSKRAVVEESNNYPSWFETANVVSALVMPLNSGPQLRTSCSAGQSAGLDSFALSFSQIEVGMYYRNWRIEEGILSRRVTLWQVLRRKRLVCRRSFFSDSRFGDL